MSERSERTELVLAAQTLPPGTALIERIEVAAANGYAAIGMRAKDRREAHDAGCADADIRACLDVNGVRVGELEVVVDWAADGAAGERSRRVEDRLYELADAFGADYLMAVSEVADPEHGAACFAALCERAGRHGLAVGLEFLPWTSVPDATTAWEIVRRAGAANGGVVIDAWHHFRGAADPAELAVVPAERVVAVQIDDALLTARGDPIDDTRRNRLLPGEGEFDLDGFVRTLWVHGVRGPWSVEVISETLHRRGAAQAAALSAAATRELLRRCALEPDAAR